MCAVSCLVEVDRIFLWIWSLRILLLVVELTSVVLIACCDSECHHEVVILIVRDIKHSCCRCSTEECSSSLVSSSVENHCWLSRSCFTLFCERILTTRLWCRKCASEYEVRFLLVECYVLKSELEATCSSSQELYLSLVSLEEVCLRSSSVVDVEVVCVNLRCFFLSVVELALIF